MKHKACVCAAAVILFSFLAAAPQASGAELPPADGVSYEMPSAEAQTKPAGTAVTSAVLENKYFGVSQYAADWYMGDGTVYKNTQEVEHTYSKNGKYLVTAVIPGGSWNGEILISDSAEKSGSASFIIMLAGGITVFICVCRAVPDRLGASLSLAGAALLILGAVSYSEGWL